MPQAPQWSAGGGLYTVGWTRVVGARWRTRMVRKFGPGCRLVARRPYPPERGGVQGQKKFVYVTLFPQLRAPLIKCHFFSAEPFSDVTGWVGGGGLRPLTGGFATPVGGIPPCVRGLVSPGAGLTLCV